MWAAGWRDADRLMRGAAVVGLESNFYERRTYTNDDGSVDRGVWMINSRAHPLATDDIAFDYQAATKWVYSHIYLPQGYDYGAWSAYNARLVPFLRGESTDEAVRSKVVYACEAVGNFLKQRYKVLA
jgi:hypothetical protein